MLGLQHNGKKDETSDSDGGAVPDATIPSFNCTQRRGKVGQGHGCSLLQLLRYSSHLGECFVITLFIFGLLLGATDYEACCLYPDFGSGKVTAPSEALRSFTTIFRTYQESWRFRMVGADYAA